MYQRERLRLYLATEGSRIQRGYTLNPGPSVCVGVSASPSHHVRQQPLVREVQVGLDPRVHPRLCRERERDLLRLQRRLGQHHRSLVHRRVVDLSCLLPGGEQQGGRPRAGPGVGGWSVGFRV